MLNFWKDIQYAFRTLTKNPGFAIIGIVTLALGMAVNTTVFSVVNGLILRPLPVPHPEQVTALSLQQAGDSTAQNFSYQDYLDLRNQPESFSDVFGYRVSLVGIAVDGKGDHAIISRVTGNYFSALGISPALGRLILPTEGQSMGADPILVLGYSYWQKRFGGDPNIVGKKVQVNDTILTVIGVAPEEFHGTYAFLNMDGYAPFSAPVGEGGQEALEKDWTQRSSRFMNLMGRLKPGASLQQARATMAVAAQRVAQQHPETEKGISILITPEKLARFGPDPDNQIPLVAAAFMILASLVLFVACFNIANVLLVRATVRQREMAIRAALGAGRGRLVRQHITESLLLALFGGCAGLVLANWATGTISSMPLGTTLPIQIDFHPDARVFLYALAAVLLTGIIVGIMPGLRIARTDVNSILHEGGRGSSDGPRRHLARNSLVVAQVTGSMVLLIVAGLFVRSLGKAQNIPLGINTSHILNLSLDVKQIGYSEVHGREFYRELDSRLNALPGVIAVAEGYSIPMGYISADENVTIAGHPIEAGKQPPNVLYNRVSPNYFDTLQIPLLQGRTFTFADNEKAPGVAVITQAMAKKFWPSEEAIGKHFRMEGSGAKDLEVIGVLQDGKYRSLTEDPPLPFFYVPFSQNYDGFRVIHVKTSAAPESVAPQVQEQVRALAPNLPIAEMQTMTQAMQGINGFFLFRFGAQLSSVMGFLGLILAVIGIYSVVSYAAARRTQEIGIRIALGASRAIILKMVLKQGLAVVGIGLVIGLGVALAGTRLLADLFVGIKPTDPLTFAGVAILLAGVALLACWIPAHRATRVDPLIALRHE
jgi:predicted permease